VTEAELLESVRTLCAWYGVMIYHTHDSRRSEPGFPDLVLVGKRVLYRELKSQTGGLGPLQERWLSSLEQAGENVGVWRPEHWPERIGAELSAIRIYSVSS
jgi:VRR-NUC domain